MCVHLPKENPNFTPFEAEKKRKKIAKIVFDKSHKTLYNI